MVSDYFSFFQLVFKYLRTRPLYILAVVVYFLALLFGTPILQGSEPFEQRIFAFLLILGFPIFIIVIFVNVKSIGVDEYKTDNEIHRLLEDEWEYVESVITEERRERIKGTVKVEPIEDFQVVLKNGIDRTAQERTWNSIYSGWVGDNIFVFYQVTLASPNNGKEQSWRGFVMLDIEYDPSDTKRAIKMSGRFHTIGRPRIGTITLTRAST